MFRVHRVWSLLQPQRPRHPIVRALLGLFAICALMVLLTIGAVIGLIVFAGSLVWRMFHPALSIPPAQHASPADDDDCIDGEYSVLRKPLPRTTHS